MVRYIGISIASGILFGFLDGMINANPFAVSLFEVYTPIAKPSINVPAGVAIDVLYGFALTGLFLLLYKSIPGKTKLAKGAGFGVVVWFLRVFMYAASQYMMFTVPANTLLYILATGFAEMMTLGVFIGVFSKK